MSQTDSNLDVTQLDWGLSGAFCRVVIDAGELVVFARTILLYLLNFFRSLSVCHTNPHAHHDVRVRTTSYWFLFKYVRFITRFFFWYLYIILYLII